MLVVLIRSRENGRSLFFCVYQRYGAAVPRIPLSTECSAGELCDRRHTCIILFTLC